MNDIIKIGFDKDGDADFGISSAIEELDYNKMNELRAMVVVALGTAEDMWRRSRVINTPEKLNPNKTNPHP